MTDGLTAIVVVLFILIFYSFSFFYEFPIFRVFFLFIVGCSLLIITVFLMFELWKDRDLW